MGQLFRPNKDDIGGKCRAVIATEFHVRLNSQPGIPGIPKVLLDPGGGLFIET